MIRRRILTPPKHAGWLAVAGTNRPTYWCAAKLLCMVVKVAVHGAICPRFRLLKRKRLPAHGKIPAMCEIHQLLQLHLCERRTAWLAQKLICDGDSTIHLTYLD
jgi:hypothetical protein